MILVARKLMVWSIIVVLVFSSLTFAIPRQLSNGQQREIKTQDFVPGDGSLDPNKEPVRHDLNEDTEKIEANLPEVTMQNNIPQNLSAIPEDSIKMLREFEYQDVDRGEIRTVGVAVYSDSNFNSLPSVDWGSLEPGGKNRIECYKKNTGTSVSKLTLDTANWTPPEAATYITLTWDYNGQRLDIDETILVTLTLNISKNIQEITEFFFDIIIIGSNI